jgi:hypothetical protein
MSRYRPRIASKEGNRCLDDRNSDDHMTCSRRSLGTAADETCSRLWREFARLRHAAACWRAFIAPRAPRDSQGTYAERAGRSASLPERTSGVIVLTRWAVGAPSAGAHSSVSFAVAMSVTTGERCNISFCSLK